MLLGAALLLEMRAAHAYWLELLVLLWLVPLAVYDLQRKEVPHMASVGVPCLAAMVFAVAVGAWQVSAVAALIVAVSERDAIRSRRARRWLLVATLLIVCLLVVASGEAAPGAIAVLGFWLAYELGWWAGADAMAAIALALLWPSTWLLVALAGAHLAVWPFVWLARNLHALPRRDGNGDVGMRLRPHTSHGTTFPGLPVITLTVILLFLTELIGQSRL
jgi:hypothetical protein